MTVNLTEAEMRQALFGNSRSAPSAVNEAPAVKSTLQAPFKPSPRKSSSPRLRVTLKVAKIYEGGGGIFTFDANTLSSIVAEQEA